jgi:hypothetical protein
MIILNPQELAMYSALFKQLETHNQGFIDESRLMEFLQTAKIPISIQKDLLSFCRKGGQGFDFDSFSRICRLNN